MKKIFLLSAMTITLVLQGCGSKLSGTYSMDVPFAGKSSYIFDGSDKLIINNMGMKVEVKYKLEGKNIKIETPQGNMILTMPDENTIEGPMGMKYVKEK